MHTESVRSCSRELAKEFYAKLMSVICSPTLASKCCLVFTSLFYYVGVAHNFEATEAGQQI